MALEICKVTWAPLHYTGHIGDNEFHFLDAFISDDGTYLINEDWLDGRIEDYDGELPQDLIQLLREAIKDEGGSFSIVIA